MSFVPEYLITPLVILIQIGSTESSPHLCPYGWDHDMEDHKCFKLFANSPKSWNQAGVSCGQYEFSLEAGHLVHITDERLFEFIIQINNKTVERFWTGLNNCNGKRMFVYGTERTPVKYLPWGHGHPINHKNDSNSPSNDTSTQPQQCVYASTENTTIYGSPCDVKRHYICELRARRENPCSYNRGGCSDICVNDKPFHRVCQCTDNEYEVLNETICSVMATASNRAKESVYMIYATLFVFTTVALTVMVTNIKTWRSNVSIMKQKHGSDDSEDEDNIIVMEGNDADFAWGQTDYTMQLHDFQLELEQNEEEDDNDNDDDDDDYDDGDDEGRRFTYEEEEEEEPYKRKSGAGVRFSLKDDISRKKKMSIESTV